MRFSAALLAISVSALVACGGSDDLTGDTPGADGGGTGGEGGTSNPDGGTPNGGDGGSPTDDGGASTGLHVVPGTGGAPGHIVDSSGKTVQFHGVDRSGTEDTCDYGDAFDVPVDQAAVDKIKSWNANAVRVPLNEDCWFGINGVTTGGAAYKSAIATYVDLLSSNGLYVILDLHWAAPGTQKAQGQLGMADADHSPQFWTEIATTYGNRPNIVFDLFNEPFITDWDCWLIGGTCAKDYSNATYQAAGMATLLKAVRSAGAKNVVMMGGLSYSSQFDKWVEEVNKIPTLGAPNDGLTTENVVASWHTYGSQSVQTMCPSQYNGYDASLHCVNGTDNAKNYGIDKVLAAGFSVVTGEIGIDTYASNPSPYSTTQAGYLTTWLDSTLTYLDGQGQSYLAWDWNTQAPPILLSNFDGTPTPYFGVTYKTHLAALPK
ncbi:MAG TPA: cellulase family glycosylhydrolase [Polyangiaceae bacterium]